MPLSVRGEDCKGGSRAKARRTTQRYLGQPTDSSSTIPRTEDDVHMAVKKDGRKKRGEVKGDGGEMSWAGVRSYRSCARALFNFLFCEIASLPLSVQPTNLRWRAKHTRNFPIAFYYVKHCVPPIRHPTSIYFHTLRVHLSFAGIPALILFSCLLPFFLVFSFSCANSCTPLSSTPTSASDRCTSLLLLHKFSSCLT